MRTVRSGANDNRRPTMCRNASFTLIELLAVVILLSILAAVVVPQIIVSSEQAYEEALRSDLHAVRAQIKLYQLQHRMYPGFIRAGGDLGAWDAERFVTQLLCTTDVDGHIGPGDLGPYLRKFPANRFCKHPALAASVLEGQPDGSGPGWAFAPETGEFHANDADAEHRDW